MPWLEHHACLCRKLTAGFCHHLFLLVSSRYCRAKYTSPGSSIYYYSVEWDASELSWEAFRSKVLGATDPEQAASGSMRKEILQRWEALFEGVCACIQGTEYNGIRAPVPL